jgi:hypothetical protein
MKVANHKLNELERGTQELRQPTELDAGLGLFRRCKPFKNQVQFAPSDEKNAEFPKSNLTIQQLWTKIPCCDQRVLNF